MKRTHFLCTLLLASALLTGCVAVTKVEVGQAVVKDRLSVKVESAWNRFEQGMPDDAPTWTADGFSVDALRFYVGVKDQQELGKNAPQAKAQPLIYRTSMQAAEVVGLFQSLMTRDGSTFVLDKLEPYDFAGGKGFRYEFSMIRKSDSVQMKGVSYASVRNGELFMMMYTAPRLSFFAKRQAQIERMAQSATILK